MDAGDCYWAETWIDRDGEVIGHLFFVLLDPIGAEQLTIAVPCCTIRGEIYDNTCELQKGVHRFITVRSYVYYNLAEVMSFAEIDGMIKARQARWRDPIDPEVLERVRDGLMKSPHTKRRIKEWYQNQVMDDIFDSI